MDDILYARAIAYVTERSDGKRPNTDVSSLAKIAIFIIEFVDQTLEGFTSIEISDTDRHAIAMSYLKRFFKDYVKGTSMPADIESLMSEVIGVVNGVARGSYTINRSLRPPPPVQEVVQKKKKHWWSRNKNVVTTENTLVPPSSNTQLPLRPITPVSPSSPRGDRQFSRSSSTDLSRSLSKDLK
jgi:hypothetical protein